MVAPVIVSVRPRSSSSPVPAFRLPNAAVAYQSVRQGVAGLPDSASDASCGLSPSAVPPGPNAVALTGITALTRTAVGDGRALGGTEAVVTLGAALGRALPGGPLAPAVAWRAADGRRRRPLRADHAGDHLGGREPNHGQRQDHPRWRVPPPNPDADGPRPPDRSSSLSGRPASCAASYWRISASRVGADDRGDRADVTAHEEVAAARGEVVVLDGADQSFADTGARADVRDGQPGLAPRPG